MFPANNVNRRWIKANSLSLEELRELYEITDWRFVLVDEHVPRKYNGITTINIFKAFALPFVIEIPSEHALSRELKERETLQVLCGFIPGEQLPSRGTFWNFRNKFANIFPGLMQKILISMVLSGKQPNFNLPFAIPVPDAEKPPEGQHIKIQWDEYRPPIELWITSKDSGDDEAISLDSLKTQLKSAKDFGEYRKLVTNFEKSERAPKRGISGDLHLPAEVKTKLYSGEIIRFAIDNPFWLETLSQHTDSVRTVGPSSFRPYSACNVLVIKKEGNKQKILLSRRQSGFGKESFALPGGKQQTGETLEQCSCRELKEETGIILLKSRPVSLRVTRYPGKPQVYSVGVLAEEYEGVPRTVEHGQHEEWKWFGLDNLPEPLFAPTKLVISQFLENKYPNLEWSDVEAQIAKSTGAMEQLSLPGLI